MRVTFQGMMFGFLFMSVACSWFEPDRESDSGIAAPVFNPPPGVYLNEKRIVVTCAEPGAEIRYTINGTDPTENDPAVANGDTLEILCSTVLKARTYKSGVEASPVSIGEYEIEFEWVLVPGGTFLMGDAFGDGDADEVPVHGVTVSGFAMSRTEVTQKLYYTMMGENPSEYRWWTLPVEGVNFDRAVAFCNELSLEYGLTPCYWNQGSEVMCNFSANGYRLPTEAEWEFAARGGCLSRGTRYSGSDNADSVAWHSGNAGQSPHEVAQKMPNELGLFDMSGNVWEWCWDWYGPYSSDAQVDPRGPDSGSVRTLRGGSWWFAPWNHRCALRYYFAHDLLYKGNLGFRIVRAL